MDDNAMHHDAAALVGNRKITPMLRQYLDAKAEHPEAVLLFRMGDFYELFFEDAKIAARELDLTLTTRDKGPDAIPMAGMPHHAVASYIARLVERGFTVAICDQMEDPKKAKGLVRREVTRLVTPGTATDLDTLDPATTSYLAYVGPADGSDGHYCTVALLDLLAGELLCTDCEEAALRDELRRTGAREVLVEPVLHDAVAAQLVDAELPVRVLPGEPVAEETVRAMLAERFGCDLVEGLAEGGGASARLAVYRLITFAEATQRRRLRHLMAPRAYRVSDHLVLDEATRRNLELTETLVTCRRVGSLRWHLDRCETAMGSRLLCQWLLFPLRDLSAINARLDAVEGLKRDRSLRQRLRGALDGVRDIERLVGRVAVGRATPRDLGALRASLGAVAEVKALAAGHPSPLGQRWVELDEASDLRDLLEGALVEDPPVPANEGGIFARGFRADLDELIALSTEGHGYLAELERRQRERTGIGSLKVRYNKVFGYYIEVTKANLDQVPDDYIRKQTLVGAERFITAELKEFEDRVLTADERRKEREQELFEELLSTVGQQTRRLRAVSRLVAETDAVASLAEVADEGRYVRPELCREPVLELQASRHPVLERMMPGGERFVPNDVHIDTEERQLVIVTGPNMAGKSTVMRQAALSTLLAHMGSFVPASRARVGLCDRLFTRVGASDNISRGQSTFMVEMVETATILRQASRDSLVLLDEIGRGTSTFDGVSIAWAVAEHMHDRVGCRAMFATHYHELTDLGRERPRITNVSVAVKESEDKVVFLRHLVEGPANRSYGIQVAQLAGVPSCVLARAREILAELEDGAGGGEVEVETDGGSRGRPRPRRGKLHDRQLSLFRSRGEPSAQALPLSPEPPRSAAPPKYARLVRELQGLDLLNMTPVQALVALERLKGLAG